MKRTENQEIGELLKEITKSGFGDIQTDIDDSGAGMRIVEIHAWNHSEHGEAIYETGNSLVEVLGKVVDSIRARLGKPPRETLVKAEGQTACVCGSEKPLEIVRSYVVSARWNRRDADGPCHSRKIEPGEIGTCPDCGRCYTF